MARFAPPSARARRPLAVLAAALLLAAPAGAEEPPSAAYVGITGLGATICTLAYAPTKLAYALGGTLISGFAWLWTLGDRSVAGPILRSAVRGDYVVTPAHLEGRRRLEFVGSQY